MRHDPRWTGRSRRLMALLLAVTVPAAATLVWLGIQLLQRDRSLAAQREQEWRLARAQSIVQSLERSLAGAEGSLHQGTLPAGMVRFVVYPRGVEAHPADRVLWLNGSPPLTPMEDARFIAAERDEFQNAPDRAAAVYEAEARSSTPSVRVGALVRLARIRRQHRQWDAAVAAYRELSAIDDVSVAGAPADLQARRTLCAVLVESGRTAEAQRETASLEADFFAGRWRLDESAWQLTASELRTRTGRVEKASDRELFSRTADTVLEMSRRDPTYVASGALERRIIVVDQIAITSIWRRGGSETTVLAIAPTVLMTWIAGLVPSGSDSVRVWLTDAAGALVAGTSVTDSPAVVKLTPSETHLPWTVRVSALGASPLADEFAGRRRLLLAGLAAILLLLGGGGYALWHVLQQELAVSRLQTDFVAAVSHEFRTPLTSLRHVTELLDESDDLPPDRRKAFYQTLGRNTERLHRLVESLLDFSRMEGGKKPYDLRPVDAGELVADVVTAFQREVAPRGFQITLAVDQSPLRIKSDALSMTHALWNLLDNAVKYSPEGRAVHIAVCRRDDSVAISVRDSGIGIPRHERKDIFERFVRGEQANRLGIKGTGLGLAMVSHIVQAHRGTIELKSEEGKGSTFTVVLPAEKGTLTFVTSPAARSQT